MDLPINENQRVLLIDTCGETAGIALCAGESVVAAEDLDRGKASAEIVQALRRLLAQCGWQLQTLGLVGVVCGPGSFTGTRAGLAAAKGLCEAVGLPMAAVSRLEVLADTAGLKSGYAALDAGRGEVYAREVSTGREWLCALEDLRAQCQGQLLALAEMRLLERFSGCHTVLHALHAADSLGAVMRQFKQGGSDPALTDANYVRQEAHIYPKSAGVQS